MMIPSDQIIEVPQGRFRSFALKYEKQLSTNVLKDLLSDKKFISKYTSIKALKIDDEIQALLIEDYMRISYTIDVNGIEGKSPFITDPEIIRDNLRKMGDLIKSIYELDYNYVMIDGLDFREMENINLDKLIAGSPLLKTMKNSVDSNIFTVQVKFVMKTNKGEKIVNLVYPTQQDLSGKKLLVEADEEYINKVLEALKNG